MSHRADWAFRPVLKIVVNNAASKAKRFTTIESEFIAHAHSEAAVFGAEAHVEETVEGVSEGESDRRGLQGETAARLVLRLVMGCPVFLIRHEFLGVDVIESAADIKG